LFTPFGLHDDGYKLMPALHCNQGIVGVKGRYAFGDERRWYVPYYADIGTGESKLTWQVAGGLGYAWSWGGVFAMWRYLDYNFKSDKKLQDINFNGPMLGATFAW
jgi:hypothetical protein